MRRLGVDKEMDGRGVLVPGCRCGLRIVVGMSWDSGESLRDRETRLGHACVAVFASDSSSLEMFCESAGTTSLYFEKNTIYLN